MRAILVAGLALALSACGGGETADNGANTLTDDNLMMDENLMLDANTSMNGMGGMDANMTANSSTENMMMKDAMSNDADTNLANGL